MTDFAKEARDLAGAIASHPARAGWGDLERTLRRHRAEGAKAAEIARSCWLTDADGGHAQCADTVAEAILAASPPKES